MTTVKRAKLRPAKSKASTTRSSSPSAATPSTSILRGELEDRPDADIRSITVDELREMHRRGEFYPTRRGTHEGEIELDEDFWARAKMMPPLFPSEKPRSVKTSVHLRVDPDVLSWFKRQGKGHLTRMNAVLRAYYEANRKKAS